MESEVGRTVGARAGSGVNAGTGPTVTPELGSTLGCMIESPDGAGVVTVGGASCGLSVTVC